jgi:hypothetical protein
MDQAHIVINEECKDVEYVRLVLLVDDGPIHTYDLVSLVDLCCSCRCARDRKSKMTSRILLC